VGLHTTVLFPKGKQSERKDSLIRGCGANAIRGIITFINIVKTKFTVLAAYVLARQISTMNIQKESECSVFITTPMKTASNKKDGQPTHGVLLIQDTAKTGNLVICGRFSIWMPN
jgi:hypothetical protein